MINGQSVRTYQHHQTRRHETENKYRTYQSYCQGNIWTPIGIVDAAIGIIVVGVGISVGAGIGIVPITGDVDATIGIGTVSTIGIIGYGSNKGGTAGNNSCSSYLSGCAVGTGVGELLTRAFLDLVFFFFPPNIDASPAQSARQQQSPRMPRRIQSHSN